MACSHLIEVSSNGYQCTLKISTIRVSGGKRIKIKQQLLSAAKMTNNRQEVPLYYLMIASNRLNFCHCMLMFYLLLFVQGLKVSNHIILKRFV